MKINELKIGDRVRYRQEEGVCGTKHSTIHELEGNILEIRQEYGGFFQITHDSYYNNQTSVKFKDIICKLEPYVLGEPIICKEIPIETEQKTSLEELSEGLQRVAECARKAGYSLDDFIYSNWKCSNPPEKKSVSKSFKFEVSPIKSFSIDYKNKDIEYCPRRDFEGTLTIRFNHIKFLDNNSYPSDFNRTYIIEIKEKK